MKKKLRSLRRETIGIEGIGKGFVGSLTRVNGSYPYITVSNTDGGWISDRSVKKLKRWCEEILAARNHAKS